MTPLLTRIDSFMATWLAARTVYHQLQVPHRRHSPTRPQMMDLFIPNTRSTPPLALVRGLHEHIPGAQYHRLLAFHKACAVSNGAWRSADSVTRMFPGKCGRRARTDERFDLPAQVVRIPPTATTYLSGNCMPVALPPTHCRRGRGRPAQEVPRRSAVTHNRAHLRTRCSPQVRCGHRAARASAHSRSARLGRSMLVLCLAVVLSGRVLELSPLMH